MKQETLSQFTRRFFLATGAASLGALATLYMNGIVEEKGDLNEKTLPQIRMPNRDGFVPDPRPDVPSTRRKK